jgi:hypothetical protein
MRQGELLPIFQRHFFHSEGPVDFTVFATLKFRMVHHVNTELIIEGTATGDASGNASYSWAAGDTDISGDYDAVIIGDEGLPTQQTFPTDGNIRITITAAI